MWQYQRLGFEPLLLAELQRQQRCNQFCDTVLEAEGVSVPAHSCVLSAFSPQLLCALSSGPSPPTGQRNVLEFQALRARTLIRLVGLLYSGQMVGEGERERQEAISAAAVLGIHGLVEVRQKDVEDGNEEGGQRKEVGVQTEPLTREKSGVREGEWRREVRDGSTLLWKETNSDKETQMGEVETSIAHPPHPAAPVQTVDLTAIQSSGAPEPHLLPHHVPLALLCPPDSSRTPAHHAPSLNPVLIGPTEDATAAGCTPIFVLPLSYSSGVPPSFPSGYVSVAGSSQVSEATDLQSWGAGLPGAGTQVMGEGFEQFEGNIPAFISYFLNPGQEEGSGRRRAGRRRGRGAGRARKAGTGERRARGRPRGTTAGRGRGAMQTAETEEVVVVPQRDWMKRCRLQASRTGKGGGVTGRKFYPKSREMMQPIKICLKRRGRGSLWEISQMTEEIPHSERGGAKGHRRKRDVAQQNGTQQLTQDGFPVSKRRRVESVPLASSPLQLYNLQTNKPPVNPPTTSPPSESPPPYVSAAPALLHTTALPLPPLAQEDQVEQIDRLLEEVMMGLDILPNNNSNNYSAQHPLPHPHPTNAISCISPSDDSSVQQDRRQHCVTVSRPDAALGVHGSTTTVAVATGVGGSIPANCEVLVLQQQQEQGELTDILDHFLRSFEQQVASSGAGLEKAGQSDTQAKTISSQPLPHTGLRKSKSHQLAQAVIPALNTSIPVVRTQPPPSLLSPLRNSAQPPPTPPPAPATLPPGHGVVIKEREEEEQRVLTRRQSTGRTSTPAQPAVVRLTKLQETEKACTKTLPSRTQLCKKSTCPHKPPEAQSDVIRTARPLVKRRKQQRLLSEWRVKARRLVGTSDAKTRNVCKQGQKVPQNPQQMPELTLERSGPLPGTKTRIATQNFRYQNLKVESPIKTKSQVQTAKTSPPSVKTPVKSLPNKKHSVKWRVKTYPIRSRLAPHIMTMSVVEEPLSGKHQVPASQPACTLPEVKVDGGGLRAAVSTAQLEPAEHRDGGEHMEKKKERQTVEGWQVLPEVDTAQEDEEMAWAKIKIKLRKTGQNVERSGGRREVEWGISSGEDVFIVNGDSDQSFDVLEDEDSCGHWAEKDHRLTHHRSSPDGQRKTPALSHFGTAKAPTSQPLHSALEVNLGSTGSSEEEEEVDVIGGTSPFPDPLPIIWADVLEHEKEEEEEEEGEGEEIDVIGLEGLLC